MSLTPLHLWHIFFVLLAMNGLLPAELKFRENISHAGLCVSVLINIKRLFSFSTAIFIADLFVYTFLLSIFKHYMISFTFNVTSISSNWQCSCTPVTHVSYFSFIYTFFAN